MTKLLVVFLGFIVNCIKNLYSPDCTMLYKVYVRHDTKR